MHQNAAKCKVRTKLHYYTYFDVHTHSFTFGMIYSSFNIRVRSSFDLQERHSNRSITLEVDQKLNSTILHLIKIIKEANKN